MIPIEELTYLESSNDIEEVEYVIKADKEAFRTLCSTIYSNKVKSPIRELCTNAFDSHVMAGKAETPFVVHLPNAMEPFFSVRDDGIGLSDLDIRGELIELTDNFGNKTRKRRNGIYTTFFDSNKRTIADAVGMLGLGSKSPFAYTDQFSISSRWNGVETVYNSFINKLGRPAIGKLGESQTNDGNGVEIKFAVKAIDFQTFYSEAQNILRWFKTKPKVIGYKDFAYVKPDYLVEKEDYQIYRVKTSTSYIVMGNIAYPITYNNVWNLNVSNDERKILEWGCNLYVPIGSVNITANRESINYDSNATTAVKAILAKVLADTKFMAQDEIKAAATKWEARKIVYKNKHSLLYSLHGNNNLQYQNSSINENLTIPTGGQAETIEQYRSRKKKRISTVIVPNGNPIYFNDMKHGGIVRVNNEVQTKGIASCYLLSDVSEQWLKDEGLDKVVIRTSTLPKPIYTPRVSTGAKDYCTAYKYKNNGYNVAADNWGVEQVDMTQGGVYVEIFKYYITPYTQNPPATGKNQHPNEIRKLATALEAIDKTVIWGIRPSDIERVHKKYPNKWIKLEDHATKLLNTPKVMGDLQLIEDFAGLSYTYQLDYFTKRTFGNKSLFGEFIAKYLIAKNKVGDTLAQHYKTLSNYYPVVLNKINNLRNFQDKVYKKYPLYKHVSIGHETVGLLCDYINKIDLEG